MQNKRNNRRNSQRESTTDYQTSKTFQSSRMPSEIDIEQSLLGAMMMYREVSLVVEPILTAEMFYTESNQKIYKAIMELIKANAPVDIMVVSEKLRKEGMLESVGGAYYITQLTQYSHRVSDPQYYAMVVLEKYFYRECYIRMSQIAQAAIDQTMEIDELNCEMARQIQLLGNMGTIGNREHKWSDSIKNSMIEYDKRKRLAMEGKSVGIESGIANLDALTSGFLPSENIILCARPSMGKSAFALTMAQNMAKKGHPVVIFSMEMSSLQLSNRAILGASQVDPINFKSGELTPIEEMHLEDGAKAISELPIIINDSAMISMTQIHARAAALKREGKCEVIFVDYIQLVSSSRDKGYQNREQEVAQVSRAAKMIAQDLNITVFMLSQLNRQCEARVDKHPMLHDLRDSGSLEQDADIVMAIHREEYYNRVPENRGKGEVLLLKNRNGAVATATFTYNSSMTVIK